MFYTGKGDDGFTSLFRRTTRIKKDAPTMQILGALDELNSWLGIIKVKATADDDILLSTELQTAQENLFIIQAKIAGSKKNITADKIKKLEKTIKNIENKLPPINQFIVPGGTEIGALLDFGRALARRTERELISFLSAGSKNHDDYQNIKTYLNRLSSLLFALARITNSHGKHPENHPHYT